MELRETLFWKHRDDLLRIMTVLWAMAGLGSRETIRRSLHLAVTRLLRPAEAATRRLIVVLAQGIAVSLKPPRAGAAQPDQGRPQRPTPPRRPGEWKNFALAERLPRWPDLNGQARAFPTILPGPDRDISGRPLVLRFDALCHALDDLHGQAQRLARWTALRRRARRRGRFCTTQPLRPGPPLDLRGAARRRLRKHELFSILTDAHRRAGWAGLQPGDTS